MRPKANLTVRKSSGVFHKHIHKTGLNFSTWGGYGGVVIMEKLKYFLLDLRFFGCKMVP